MRGKRETVHDRKDEILELPGVRRGHHSGRRLLALACLLDFLSHRYEDGVSDDQGVGIAGCFVGSYIAVRMDSSVSPESYAVFFGEAGTVRGEITNLLRQIISYLNRGVGLEHWIHCSGK